MWALALDGEQVGDAYIRIHSDGSRLPQEIKDDYRRAESAHHDAGKRASQAYNDGFDEEYDKRRKTREDEEGKSQKDVLNSIRRQRGQYEAVGKFLASDQVKGYRESLRKELSRGGAKDNEIADRIFNTAAARARAESDIDAFFRTIRKLGPEITNSLRDIQADEQKIERDRNKRAKTNADYLLGVRLRSLAEEARANESARTREQSNSQYLLGVKLRYFAEERARAKENEDYLAGVRRRSLADEQSALKTSRDRQLANQLYLTGVRRRSEKLAASDAKRRLLDVKNYTEGAREAETERYNHLSRMSRSFANQDRDETRRRIRDALELVRVSGDNSLISPLLRDLRLFNTNSDKGFTRLSTGIRRSTRDLSDGERRIKRYEDRLKDLDVGKLFGKGSRNNFFNAIGSAVGAFANAGIRGTLGLSRRLRGLSDDFRVAWREGDTLGRKLRNVGNVAGGVVEGGFKLLLKGLLAGFGAMNLFGAVAGPLAALLSMLAGTVVALASTIGIGLVGAVATLLPLIPVLIAGVGVIALAFAGLSKEQKAALKIKLKPIGDEIKGLRKVAQKGILGDIGPQSKIAASAIRTNLRPIVANTAKALSGAFTTFLKGLNGPQFKQDAKAFSKDIPEAITKLGKIGTNVFTGFTGLFRNLFPYTQKFLSYLVKLTQRFTDFQHSAKGTSSVKEFMDRATTSAKQLFKFIGAVYRVTRDLFKAGEKTGDGLFQSMTDSLNRFDRYITGRGKSAVRGFFDDVKGFASAVGKFFGGIGKLFGALDTPQTRQSLNTILEVTGQLGTLVASALPAVFAFQHVFFAALGKVAGDLKDIITPLLPLVKTLTSDLAVGLGAAAVAVATALHPLLQGLAAVARFIGAHPDIFGPIGESILGLYIAVKVGGALAQIPGILAVKFNNIRTSVNNAATGLRSSAGRYNTVLAGIGVAAGGIAAVQSTTKAGSTKNLIGSTLAGAAGGALAGSAFGPLGSVIGGVAGGLGGLAIGYFKAGNAASTESKRAIAAANLQKAAVDSLRGSIQGTAEDYKQATKAQVAGALTKTGTLATASRAGASGKDVVNAVTGADPNAIFRVNSALQGALASGKISQTAYDKATKSLTALGAAAGKTETDAELEARAIGNGVLSHNQLGTSVKKLSSALVTSNKDLLNSTGASKRNREVVRENIEELGRQAAAQVKSGKSATTASISYNNQIGVLRRNLIQMGYTSDQVDILIARYAHVPRSVQTKMLLNDQVSRAINTPLGKLHAAAIKKFAATLNLNDAAATQKLNDYIYKLEHLHDKTVTIHTRTVSDSNNKRGSTQFATARGGTFHGAQTRLIAEAGPEAVVPLHRPLSQVDPSVRALSAFAQGLSTPQAPRMASGGVVGGGRSVTIADGAIRVITPTTDPRAVAVEILDRIAAGGYG